MSLKHRLLAGFSVTMPEAKEDSSIGFVARGKTRINGVIIPPGTYRINRHIAVNNIVDLDHLLTCKVG